MAHSAQQDFVAKIKRLYPQMFVGRRVLDVGSLNVNGTNRGFFQHCDYIGIDLGKGPGVDVICKAHEYKAPPFDVVISTECLEHDRYWKQTVSNMVSLVKPGGLLLVTAATLGRAEHGTSEHRPGDSPFTASYYMNIPASELACCLNLDTYFDSAIFEINRLARDVYFAGIKGVI